MSYINEVKSTKVFKVQLRPQDMEPILKQLARTQLQSNDETKRFAISSMDVLTALNIVDVQVVVSTTIPDVKPEHKKQE